MALTESIMPDLGIAAPPFSLPAANPKVDDQGDTHRALSDYAEAEALVVVFMCNHCPYVITIEDRLIETARIYQEKGVQFIAISSNDAVAYPDDSFEHMAERAREKNYPFPYLYDEDQTVARAYDAACTPDFFLYNRSRTLVYRGRLDDGRPNQPVSQHDLRNAMDELLTTGAVTGPQWPSMGCNIKWRTA